MQQNIGQSYLVRKRAAAKEFVILYFYTNSQKNAKATIVTIVQKANFKNPSPFSVFQLVTHAFCNC